MLFETFNTTVLRNLPTLFERLCYRHGLRNIYNQHRPNIIDMLRKCSENQLETVESYFDANVNSSKNIKKESQRKYTTHSPLSNIDRYLCVPFDNSKVPRMEAEVGQGKLPWSTQHNLAKYERNN